ncbi:hypothetical protein THAOC_28446, partial [Thalassiosira oceanica]
RFRESSHRTRPASSFVLSPRAAGTSSCLNVRRLRSPGGAFGDAARGPTARADDGAGSDAPRPSPTRPVRDYASRGAAPSPSPSSTPPGRRCTVLEAASRSRRGGGLIL